MAVHRKSLHHLCSVEKSWCWFQIGKWLRGVWHARVKLSKGLRVYNCGSNCRCVLALCAQDRSLVNSRVHRSSCGSHYKKDLRASGVKNSKGGASHHRGPILWRDGVAQRSHRQLSEFFESYRAFLWNLCTVFLSKTILLHTSDDTEEPVLSH